MATRSRFLFLWVIVVVGLVASACAEEFGDPTATFDGSACRFAGPSDLDFDFSIPFVFVNESDGEAGMEVWKVPDGTTIEDVAGGDIDEIADFETDMRGMVDAFSGASATFSVLLDVPGDWLINCFTEADYPAVIFQVFDEQAGEQ
jgi:hypothetical protein